MKNKWLLFHQGIYVWPVFKCRQQMAFWYSLLPEIDVERDFELHEKTFDVRRLPKKYLENLSIGECAERCFRASHRKAFMRAIDDGYDLGLMTPET